jgi:Regulator of ribonuclease activity B
VESAFYFIFPSRDDAEKARNHLASDEHSVDLLSKEGSEHWLILRIQNMSEDEYVAADERMERLGLTLGGIYDGAEREVG